MNKRYDLFQSISQREDRTLSEEDARLVSIANDIIRATENCRKDEAKSGSGISNVVELNEREQRAAENWAKAHNYWIPLPQVFDLGIPGPSGSESDTYISADGFVYKQNNLLHTSGSIVEAILRFLMHNLIFPDTAYRLVAFTGFSGRSVYPIVRQQFIKGGTPATQNEIDCYMAAIGFEKSDIGKYYNSDFCVSDLLPKNVFRDLTGDILIIDAEIKYIGHH